MIQIACTCDEWPTAHSHSGPKQRVRLSNGTEITVPVTWLDINSWEGVEVLEEIPDEIRPWVNWKEFAHGLMVDQP